MMFMRRRGDTAFGRAPSSLRYDLRMRLFVGIPLAVAVRGELSGLAARLKSKDDGLRWTAPES